MGLAGLRRDTSKIANAISCYSAALQYDKKHLPSGDIRLTRDKNNLAVALLIAGKTATTAEKRILYLKSAAGFLVEVIADQKQRSPQGSVREANAHQDLAYALKTMGDKRGYEKEIELSLSMKHRLNPVSLCREP